MRKTKDASKEAGDEEFSDEVPDDGENEGSEDEWQPDSTESVQTRKRPQRAVVKKRRHSEEEDDDDDNEEEEEEEDDSESDSGKKGKKRRSTKKEEEEEDDDDSDDHFQDSSGTPPKDFTSGAFVVAKTDLNSGSDPTLWRIDGKALLQKYLPYKDEGKTLYKSTSTYSGWSVNNKERYIAAQVSFKVQSRTETIVELDLESSQKAAKEEKEN